MSQQHVQTVRRLTEAFNERDVGAWAAAVADDFEFVPYLATMVESKVYRGRAGLQKYFDDADAAWENVQARVEYFRDLGDRVVYSGELRARGRASAIETRVPLAWVAEFRGDKLRRVVSYASMSEALKAAQLDERASPNLDLVGSIYAAWERGDWSSAEWAHPEIEYVIADGPAPDRWVGLAGMAEGSRDFLRAWEDWRVEVDEYRELDDERILVLFRARGRGKTSGLDLGQMGISGAHLFNIREGKVTRLVHYLGREVALADLGLDPETSSAGS